MFALATVFTARFVLARTASLTGTNSVDVATVIANAGPRQETCIRDLDIPSETGRLEVSLVALNIERGARIRAYLDAGTYQAPLRQLKPLGALGFLPFALPNVLDRALKDAAVCLTPLKMTVGFGGAFVQRLPKSPITTVAGSELAMGDVGVRYLRPDGLSPRVLDAIPKALRRATVFESSFGSALVWMALPALLMLVYVVIRTTALADAKGIRRLAVIAAAVTFVHGAAWAVLLHPFHGADESEHFAYAQYLAETNRRADAGFSKRPPYATSQLRLLQALHHNSTILNPTSRPRWESSYAAEYRNNQQGTRDDDGGGFTTGASGHSPLYYAVIGIPYRLMSGSSDMPSVLLVMRLWNAALAAAVAALAVLTAGLVFRGRATIAWLAGVLVGLQPVFGSVAGAVNNDTAVNLAAAAMIFVLIRSWSLEPTVRLACVVGTLLVVLPVAKITGFALFPVVAVAALVIAMKHGYRTASRWVAVAGIVAAVTASVWIFAAAPLLGGSRGSLVNQHPAAPSTTQAAPARVNVSLGTHVNYLLQTVVPRPTFGKEHWKLSGASALERWPLYAIYVNRGYGLFGWKSAELSRSLLRGIFLWLACGWGLSVVAIVRHRDTWRQWGGGAVILAAAVPFVLAFVSYAFATNDVLYDFGEQGRYVFTALVPLGVMFSAACFSLSGRLRYALAGAMSAAAACLALIAWASALRGWFI